MREPRPERRVGAAEDADRVRDRDAAEAQPAQQLIRLRLERRPSRPESRVDRMADHHAGHAGADRRPERGQVLAAQDPVDPRDVRRLRRRAESREVLRAGGGSESARERDAVLRLRELPRAERPVGQVEHRREGRVHAGPTEPGRRLAAGAERLVRAPVLGCGGPRCERAEGPHRPSLLVGENDRPARSRCVRRSTGGRARRRSPRRRGSRRRPPPPPSRAASSPPRLTRPSPSGAAQARSRSWRAPGHGTLA